ncbi:MAG: oxidoreductase [Ignavibacteriales bacterium]
MSKIRTALVAGSTGLVGGELLKQLLEDAAYAQVYSLARRPTGITHPKLAEIIIDFEHLSEATIPVVDDVFCALGTTIKKAGSQEAFSRVDFHYVVELAKEARRSGAAQFMVVSSIMADPSSKNFYLRVKGEMEQAVMNEGPETGLIFRPSTLVGERQESRWGEKVAISFMKVIDPIFVGSLKKYRNIKAAKVATAMISAAKSEPGCKRVYQSDEIAEMVD